MQQLIVRLLRAHRILTPRKYFTLLFNYSPQKTQRQLTPSLYTDVYVPLLQLSRRPVLTLQVSVISPLQSSGMFTQDILTF